MWCMRRLRLRMEWCSSGVGTVIFMRSMPRAAKRNGNLKPEDHDTYNQVGIQSSAALANGMVYFGCRDSHLYALDAASGEKRWAFDAKGSWVVGSPAVRDGKVYFPTSDSSLLYEVDAKSGNVLRSLEFNHWYLYS